MTHLQLVPHPGKSGQGLRARTWRQQLTQGSWGNAAYWLVLGLAQPAFLWNPESRPRDGTTHSRLGLSLIRQYLTDLSTASLTEAYFFHCQINPAYVKSI